MKYRLKLAVEAMQYDGTNFLELNKWGNHQIKEEFKSSSVPRVVLTTPAGDVEIATGDYIVKYAEDDFRVYPSSDFHQLYEKAEAVKVDKADKVLLGILFLIGIAALAIVTKVALLL